MKIDVDKNSFSNVVQFPTANSSMFVSDDLDDPLEDLLNEFSDFTDDDDDLLDGDEDEVGETTVEFVLSEEFFTLNTTTEMISKLNDIERRKKFYMSEIETFLPKKKR